MMCHPAPFDRHEIASSSKTFSKGKDGAVTLKNLAHSDAHGRASRKRFARLLWRAFPATSERDLAAKAAPVLGVSERQVKNWLRCENDAALRHVVAVMTLACGEEIFSLIEGRG
ncbi:hypothetical protein [Cereibacter sphaeroides]|uniref:hypothetical protein n=1 Tax=Cereibacter sphaeroides TaxID=1063 RepID=UPI003F69A440